MLAICDKSEFYIGDMPGKTLINEQSGGGGGGITPLPSACYSQPHLLVLLG